MMHYSLETRNQTSVKRYGFLCVAKNLGKI